LDTAEEEDRGGILEDQGKNERKQRSGRLLELARPRNYYEKKRAMVARNGSSRNSSDDVRASAQPETRLRGGKKRTKNEASKESNANTPQSSRYGALAGREEEFNLKTLGTISSREGGPTCQKLN